MYTTDYHPGTPFRETVSPEARYKFSTALLNKLAILEQADYPEASTIELARFISPLKRLVNKVSREDTESVVLRQPIKTKAWATIQGAEAQPVLSGNPPLGYEWKDTWKTLWLKDQSLGYPLSNEVSNSSPGQPILLTNGRIAEKIGVIHQIFGPVISEGHIRFPAPTMSTPFSERDFFKERGSIGVWEQTQGSIMQLTGVELEAGNERLQQIIDRIEIPK